VERYPSVVSQSWIVGVKLAVATGIAYFLAGRFGLVLRAQPGVAVFWPASGIAVGALIALGPSARLPVAAGVFVATTACNLMIGRGAWLAIAFSVLNVGQTLFTVWFLERWFGRTFKLEDVQRVLGFFAATAIGSAIAALGAAGAISIVEPTASPLHVWSIWFAACSLGVVTVAPLLIGIGNVMRERLPRHELIEGWAGLVMLTALITFLISLPDGPWATALPEALVFPFLLWVAMRCRPVFAAAAALVVGLIVIGSTTLNIGYFESDMPVAARILSAQIFAMAAAILVVVLAAVFAERRKAEMVLAERNAQLALAGRAALVGSYTYDVNKGMMQVSEGYAAIHGLPEGTTETSYREWRTRVHPDDLARAEGLRNQAFSDRWKEDNAEYRIVLPTGEVRWIERRGSISYSKDGRPERVVGVNIDVTGRKRVEEQQRILVSELDHRVKNTLATVSAVASHTQNTSSSMADFTTALDGRLQSMARAHELLSASRWQGISVAELVRRELAPYATTDNTEINGPEVLLRAEAGQVMAMVLHELATNAAKYGALSIQNGRVSIKWGQRSNGHPRSHLVLDWWEVGGPSVVAPQNSGFGTHTIRDLIPYELGGAVDLSLAREGVRCRIELPADWLSNDGDPVWELRAYPHG
jgi:PAS domain S-box-containing protein